MNSNIKHYDKVKITIESYCDECGDTIKEGEFGYEDQYGDIICKACFETLNKKNINRIIK